MSDPASTSHASSGVRRIGSFIRILNVRLRFIVLMALVGVISANWENLMNRLDRWRRPEHASDMVATEEIEFYCPMHPNVIRSEPGNCPICGMPLSKRAKTSTVELPPDALGRVQLSPYRVQLGRIGTTEVDYRLMAREIRTVGIIDYDETRRAFISARIAGRMDDLFVNFTGQQIEESAPLASIYSPDLLVAQEELLAAAQRVRAEGAAGGASLENAQVLLDATRRKLLLWGITKDQVQAIISRGTPETHLTLFSPMAGIVTEKKVLKGQYVQEGDDLYTIADLHTVWLQARIFENDLAGVAIGTAVEVTSVAYPDEVFAGRITFIAYTVDPGTRTVAARVEVSNPDLRLRPGMYASAAIRLPLGRVAYVDESSSQPASDVVDTGGLARAYLDLSHALANDKADDTALTAMRTEAQRLAESSTGPASMRDRARALLDAVKEGTGKDLAALREGFKKISTMCIAILTDQPPRDMTLGTFHCPMAKADWLDIGDDVLNPYYGSQMLRCGSKTGSIAPGAVRESDRFVTGYYCPVYPDRLFDQPQHCPIDKFPLKRATVEKVLAVPATAVIHTGMRTIVYREAQPGVFDMVEVKLSPKAGDHYPVTSGLKAGDRVAARGAFLVDAENRLNPSAGATYFGASGTSGK